MLTNKISREFKHRASQIPFSRYMELNAEHFIFCILPTDLFIFPFVNAYADPFGRSRLGAMVSWVAFTEARTHSNVSLST
jgi:hypothetical protein